MFKFVKILVKMQFLVPSNNHNLSDADSELDLLQLVHSLYIQAVPITWELGDEYRLCSTRNISLTMYM